MDGGVYRWVGGWVRGLSHVSYIGKFTETWATLLARAELGLRMDGGWVRGPGVCLCEVWASLMVSKII